MEKKKLTWTTILILSAIGIGCTMINRFTAISRYRIPGIVVKLIAMVTIVIALEMLLTWFLKKMNPKNHRAGTILSVATSVTNYAAAILIICLGLSICGVDVATIFASLGILALIIGFGAESLIADVITGLFILFESQYNKGDIIEIGSFRGTVQEIGIRTTSVKDNGGNIKIINNSEMRNVINRSDVQSVALCDFSIPYETDIDKLNKIIPAICETIGKDRADILLEQPKYLGIQELAASAIVLRFAAPVKEENVFSAMRAMNQDFLVAFRKEGIECPFAQLDVHNR